MEAASDNLYAEAKARYHERQQTEAVEQARLEALEQEAQRSQPSTLESDLARMSTSVAPEAKDFWKASWARNHQQMEASLLQAIDAERSQYSKCPHCGYRIELRHPDTRARTDAIKALHTLAGLTPRPDDVAQADLVVNRRLVLPGA